MIYSVWRLTTKELVCRTCGSNALVPVFSPVGQKILAEFSGPSPAAWAEPTGPMRPPAPPTQSSAREVIYDTRCWTENQFALLTTELRKSGIGWNIEADDLVVDKRHESGVDSLIATIIG